MHGGPREEGSPRQSRYLRCRSYGYSSSPAGTSRSGPADTSCEEAAAVVAAAGFDTFALVEHVDLGASAPGSIGGFNPEGADALELFEDVEFQVTTYTRE